MRGGDKARFLPEHGEKPSSVDLRLSGCPDSPDRRTILLYTHESRVDAIYIDSPYLQNRRAELQIQRYSVNGDDAYRHSKWLAMMKRRLKLAKRLLNRECSVLIVTIDEKEYLHLGLLVERLFPGSPATRTQMVSTKVNPAAVSRGGAFGRSDEYVFFVMLGTAAKNDLTWL